MVSFCSWSDAIYMYDRGPVPDIEGCSSTTISTYNDNDSIDDDADNDNNNDNNQRVGSGSYSYVGRYSAKSTDCTLPNDATASDPTPTDPSLAAGVSSLDCSYPETATFCGGWHNVKAKFIT
jgi:hypothetical protein